MTALRDPVEVKQLRLTLVRTGIWEGSAGQGEHIRLLAGSRLRGGEARLVAVCGQLSWHPEGPLKAAG